MTQAGVDHHETPVSRLQARAWAVANASYEVPNGEAYRAYAHELYELDVHERIDRLFARLRWILMQEAVSTVIPGAKNPDQARSNAAAADVPPLDESTMQRIAAIYRERVAPLVHQRW